MNESETEVLTFYSTESTSLTSSTVQPVILDSTGTTRRILRPTVVKNPGNAEACLRIEIIHERTGKNGFEPIESPNLSKLKAGEALSCSLSSKETLALRNELSKLYALGNDVGIRNGEHSYCIIKTEKNLILSKDEEKAISNLLEQCQASPGLAEKLAKTSPELIDNAYRYKLLQKKHEGFARFKVMLNEECKEQEWQNFFEEHDWIFGGIYEVEILAKVVNQPILSSPNAFGIGEKREAFELFRQNQKDIHIVTFDEVYHRAQYLLGING